MRPDLVLAIDQGTTSTRSILFDADARPLASSRRALAQIYPGPGWVEHDPEAIWADVVATARAAMSRAGGPEPARIAGIGIANQRETVVVWDRDTGAAIHNAIVWQDRRTAAFCDRLRAEGHEPAIRARTGLPLDPYFSASKLRWILDHVPGARDAAERGRLACGTIDAFLLWRLTGGRVHATDATNASRTQLLDLRTGAWDPGLLALFGIPAAMLPSVVDSAGIAGHTEPALFGRPIPIAGLAGDQQAALAGQACVAPGDAKSTYGTGGFMLRHTGDAIVASTNGLLATLACRLDGRLSYAQEGSIFVAGAAVGWLRDGLGVIGDAGETEALAAGLPDRHGVYLVPGFVGLGAPHWEPQARGLIAGLTLDTTRAHLARAALEAAAYQSHDLARAMHADGARAAGALRIDGGMAANDWFCQFLADILDTEVERPRELESTARGAAFLAGLATGLWHGPDDLARSWRRDRVFAPRMETGLRHALLAGWDDAIDRARSRPVRPEPPAGAPLRTRG